MLLKKNIIFKDKSNNVYTNKQENRFFQSSKLQVELYADRFSSRNNFFHRLQMTIAARIAHARKKESEEAHTIASTYSRLQLDSCRTRRFQRSNNARKTKKPIAEIAERKATAESPASTNTSRRAARRHNWTFNRNYNTHIYIHTRASKFEAARDNEESV